MGCLSGLHKCLEKSQAFIQNHGINKANASYPETEEKDEVFYEEVTHQDLVRAAVNVKQNAYCPYSDFRVGCAVLCKDGSIFTGVNVENASYGLSVCAERVAITNAVTAGKQSFIAAAVSCDVKGAFRGPCGACRQVFIEFNEELPLYLVKPDMTVKIIKMNELLPLCFNPRVLQEEKC